MKAATYHSTAFLPLITFAALAMGCASNAEVPEVHVTVDGQPAKLYDFDTAPQPIPVAAGSNEYICPPRPDGPEVLAGEADLPTQVPARHVPTPSQSASRAASASAIAASRSAASSSTAAHGARAVPVLTVGRRTAGASAAMPVVNADIFADPAPDRRTAATPTTARANSHASVHERAVPTQPVAAPANSPSTYTVKAGDTLWTIAQQHYGNGQRWSQISEANNIDPAKLRVGQQIRLP